ncbi:uncharacterized protein LOC131006424 [Salvia miltiorrhiza]|uniref:uncharacterized protein LOC131006424 n=1 Tax=Salvia miltiorrhiza TaxID=226208 RepID=UPI0025ABBFD7|nr:uncharacterized protein LOC131006424 [Salvia miltiorrhiza]
MMRSAPSTVPPSDSRSGKGRLFAIFGANRHAPRSPNPHRLFAIFSDHGSHGRRSAPPTTRKPEIDMPPPFPLWCLVQNRRSPAAVLQSPTTILTSTEEAGGLKFVCMSNDGVDKHMIWLIGLKNIFARQLPNMPREYIVRLLMDRRAPGFEPFL